MKDEYLTTCDECGKKTWYEVEQPCKMTRDITRVLCTGTLRLIDLSDLAAMFKPYYISRQRIEVLTPYGETMRGYVGRTTGRKPSYILLARSNSMGSSELLDNRHTITKVINKYR